MKPPEHRQSWRAICSVALLLWLALLGMGAGASFVGVQSDGPVATPVMAPESMPMATHCAPSCSLCCIAPASQAHSFSGECQERHDPVWHIHAPSAPKTEYLDPGGRQVRLPVRILYCRWLD